MGDRNFYNFMSNSGSYPRGGYRGRGRGFYPNNRGRGGYDNRPHHYNNNYHDNYSDNRNDNRNDNRDNNRDNHKDNSKDGQENSKDSRDGLKDKRSQSKDREKEETTKRDEKIEADPDEKNLTSKEKKEIENNDDEKKEEKTKEEASVSKKENDPDRTEDKDVKKKSNSTSEKKDNKKESKEKSGRTSEKDRKKEESGKGDKRKEDHKGRHKDDTKKDSRDSKRERDDKDSRRDSREKKDDSSSRRDSRSGRSPPRRKSSPDKNRDSFYCSYCKQQISSEDAYKAHMKSAFHLQKEGMIKKAITDKLHFCYTCERVFPTKIELDAHCLMARHQPLYQVKEFQEVEKIKKHEEKLDLSKDGRREKEEKVRNEIVVKLNQLKEGGDDMKKEEKALESRRRLDCFCLDCDVDCLNETNFKIHVESWRHRAVIDKKRDEEKLRKEEERLKQEAEAKEKAANKVEIKITKDFKTALDKNISTQKAFGVAPVDNIKYLCEICSLQLDSEEAYLDHLKQRKHMRKVSEMKRPFRCYVCSMDFNVMPEFNAHLQSKEHMSKAFHKPKGASDSDKNKRHGSERRHDRKEDSKDSHRDKRDSKDRHRDSSSRRHESKDSKSSRDSKDKDSRRERDRKSSKSGSDSKRTQDDDTASDKGDDQRKVELIKSPMPADDLRNKLLGKTNIVITTKATPDKEAEEPIVPKEADTVDSHTDRDKKAQEMELEAKFRKIAKEFENSPEALKEKLTKEREIDILAYQQYENSYKRLCDEEDAVRDKVRTLSEDDPQKEGLIRDMIRVQHEMRDVRGELEFREMMIIKRENLFREKFPDSNATRVMIQPEQNNQNSGAPVTIDYNHGISTDQHRDMMLPPSFVPVESPAPVEKAKENDDDLRIQLERERLLKRLGPELQSISPAMRDKLLSAIFDKDNAVDGTGQQPTPEGPALPLFPAAAASKSASSIAMDKLTEREKQLEKELNDLRKKPAPVLKKKSTKSLVPQYDDLDDKPKDDKKKPVKKPEKKVEKKPEKKPIKKKRRERSPSYSSSSESSSSSSEDDRGRKKKKTVKAKVVKKRRRSSSADKRKRSKSRDTSDKKKKRLEAAKKLAKAKTDSKKKPVKAKPKDKTTRKDKEDSSDDDVVEVTPSKSDTVNPIKAIGSTPTVSAMKTIPPTRGRTTAEIRNEQLLMWKNPAQQAVQSMFQGLARNSPSASEKLDVNDDDEAQGSPKEDVWDMAFSGTQVQEQQAEETLDLFNPNSEAPTKLTNDIWNILRNVTATVPSSSYSTYSSGNINRGLSSSKMTTSEQDRNKRTRSILKKMKDIPADVHVSSPEPEENVLSPGGIPGLSLEEPRKNDTASSNSLFQAASNKPSTPLADRGLRKTIQMPQTNNALSGFSSYPQNDPFPPQKDTPITHVLHSADGHVSIPRSESNPKDRRYHDDELSRSSLDSFRASEPSYSNLERRVDLGPALQSQQPITTQSLLHQNLPPPRQPMGTDPRPTDVSAIPQSNLDVARLVVDRALHDPVVRNQLSAGVLPPITLEALAAVLPPRSNAPTVPAPAPVQLPGQQPQIPLQQQIPRNVSLPQNIQAQLLAQLTQPIAQVAPMNAQHAGPSMNLPGAPINLTGVQQHTQGPNPGHANLPPRGVSSIPQSENVLRPEDILRLSTQPPTQPPVAAPVANRLPPETAEETAARLNINVNDPPPVRRPDETEESFYDRFDAYYALKRKQEIAERLKMQRERERELILLRQEEEQRRIALELREREDYLRRLERERLARLEQERMRRDNELRREAEERKREAEKRRKEEASKNKIPIVDGREGSHRKRHGHSSERSLSSERSSKRSRDPPRDSERSRSKDSRRGGKEGKVAQESDDVNAEAQQPKTKMVEPIPNKEEEKPPSRPVTPDLDKPPQDDWRLQNMPADANEQQGIEKEEVPTEEVLYDDPLEHEVTAPEQPHDASIESNTDFHIVEDTAAPQQQQRVSDPRQQDPYYRNSPQQPAPANRSRDHSLERPPQRVEDTSAYKGYEKRPHVDEYQRRAPVDFDRQPPGRGYPQHSEGERLTARDSLNDHYRHERIPQRDVFDSRVEDLPASAATYRGRESYRDPRLSRADVTREHDLPSRYPAERAVDPRYESRVVDERAIEGRYEDKPVVSRHPVSRMAPISNPYQEGVPPPLSSDLYRQESYRYHDRNARAERTLVVERRVEETYRLEDSRQGHARPQYPVHSAAGTSSSFPYKARPPQRQDPPASTYNYDDY